jgi:signal transduction histidine kinase
MNSNPTMLSQRERELAAIITAYSEVTEQLRQSHEQLNDEVRKMSQELENKNRELARRERLAALGEMATGVAHEIRNPLGGIQLFASLLHKDLAELPRAQTLARKISTGVDSLNHIVGDILDFAGQHEPDRYQTSLAQIVDAALDIAAARGHEAAVRFERDVSIDQYDIYADRSQMERVLLNILHNAVEGSPPDGAVRVWAEVGDDGAVAVHVDDAGPGIAPEAVDRIFNPFFTTKDTGTGLGLAICHRIVESHGGWIRATNRPGCGARFSVHVPAGRSINRNREEY